MGRRPFYFALVRFVADPARGEQVNLGMAVVADEGGASRLRLLDRFAQKLAVIEPNSDVDAIRAVLGTLTVRFGDAFQARLTSAVNEHIGNSAQLAQLASYLCNQVRLTEPRLYWATDLASAVSELFSDLVQLPPRTPAAHPHMTIGEIRELIGRTISRWWGDMVSIEAHDTQRASTAAHFADYWIKVGEPVVALIAFPGDPEEQDAAWFRRDALPAIVADFTKVNPQFKAVAVFPPESEVSEEFVTQTRRYLSTQPGIIITDTDHLPGLRDALVPSGLYASTVPPA